MPTIDDAQVENQEARRQSRADLNGQAKEVQKSAHRAQQNRRTEQAVRAERHRFEDRNKEFAAVSISVLVFSWVAQFACLAVYLVDVSVFAASADYFAKMAFPNLAPVSVAMRLLIPALIISLDIWIGLNLWDAWHKLKREPETRQSLRRWALCACLFVLLMPIFASASAIAQVMTATRVDVRQLLGAQGLAAAIFALVAHGVIMLGAPLIEKGAAYFAYRRRLKRMKRSEASFRAAAELNENECIQMFEDYWHSLSAYNREFGEEEKPGPFDQLTTELLNSRMGRRVIEQTVAEAVQARA